MGPLAGRVGGTVQAEEIVKKEISQRPERVQNVVCSYAVVKVGA